MIIIRKLLSTISLIIIIDKLFLLKINADFGRDINANDELAIYINNNIDDYWYNMTMFFKNYLINNNNNYIEHFNKILYNNNTNNDNDLKKKINKNCLNIIEYMIKNPIENEWTIKMIDSGFLNRPKGLLSGTTTELGDFDQCLSIENKFNNEKFYGKYCLSTINIPRIDKYRHPYLRENNQTKINPSWMINYINQWYENDNYYSLASSICFPSICNETEIRELLIHYYDFLQLTHFNVTHCQSNNEPRQYRFGLKISWAILIIPWLLIIPATIFELIFDDKNYSNFYKILICFSLIRNNRFLFQIKQPIQTTITTTKTKSTKTTITTQSVQRQEFRFIHGIRALSALFIMMAHAGGLIMVIKLMPISTIARYPKDAINLSKTLLIQPFFNGGLVVMTFFSISGFLSICLTASKQKLKIHFIPYVLLRWLRLTPSLIGTICLNICLETFGNGPLFHHDILWPTLRPCYENWWKHLLYFSNYLPVEDMCNISTWYLAADLQLHIVGFILLALYTYNQRLTLIICCIFIMIGVIAIIMPIVIGLTKHHLIQVLMYNKFRLPSEIGRYLIFACFMQFIPYFLGCLIGFIVLENRIIKFKKWQEWLIWTLSTIFMLFIPYSTYLHASNEMKINGDETILNAILFSLMVLLWSLSTVWIIYQCSIKPKIFISNILSANFFKPLSRLSFSLYLSHLMTIWFFAFQTRYPISINNWIDLFKLVSYTLFSALILGYLLHLSFEAPTIGLLMLFFKTNKQQSINKTTKKSFDHHHRIINHQSQSNLGNEILNIDNDGQISVN